MILGVQAGEQRGAQIWSRTSRVASGRRSIRHLAVVRSPRPPSGANASARSAPCRGRTAEPLVKTKAVSPPIGRLAEGDAGRPQRPAGEPGPGGVELAGQVRRGRGRATARRAGPVSLSTPARGGGEHAGPVRARVEVQPGRGIRRPTARRRPARRRIRVPGAAPSTGVTTSAVVASGAGSARAVPRAAGPGAAARRPRPRRRAGRRRRAARRTGRR